MRTQEAKTLIILIIIFAFSISSCKYYRTEQISNDFLGMLRKPKNRIEKRLKLNGIYHHYKESDYHYGVDFKNGIPTRYIEVPYLGSNQLYFYKNGLINRGGGVVLDSAKFNLGISTYVPDKNELMYWGVYDIEGDTLKAIIYEMYEAKSRLKPRQLLQTYFQGIIKNKDTISQWHMVAPYPKRAEAYPENKELLEIFKTPIDLFFKIIPTKTEGEADKKWVEEFKSGYH